MVLYNLLPLLVFVFGHDSFVDAGRLRGFLPLGMPAVRAYNNRFPIEFRSTSGLARSRLRSLFLVNRKMAVDAASCPGGPKGWDANFGSYTRLLGSGWAAICPAPFRLIRVSFGPENPTE